MALSCASSVQCCRGQGRVLLSISLQSSFVDNDPTPAQKMGRIGLPSVHRSKNRWVLTTQWMMLSQEGRRVCSCVQSFCLWGGGQGGADCPSAGLRSSSLGHRFAVGVTYGAGGRYRYKGPRQTRPQIQQRAFRGRVVNSKRSSILRRYPLRIHVPPVSYHYTSKSVSGLSHALSLPAPACLSALNSA